MTELRLRPVTAAELGAWRTQVIPRYAAEKASAGEWSAEGAERLATEQMDSLLPAGAETPGMPSGYEITAINMSKRLPDQGS